MTNAVGGQLLHVFGQFLLVMRSRDQEDDPWSTYCTNLPSAQARTSTSIMYYGGKRWRERKVSSE